MSKYSQFGVCNYSSDKIHTKMSFKVKRDLLDFKLSVGDRDDTMKGRPAVRNYDVGYIVHSV